MKYLLDANVFIEAKNRHYGFDFCPAFWDWLLDANARGAVFSIDKVFDELMAGTDELSDWAKEKRKRVFLPMDATALAVILRVSSWIASQNFAQKNIDAFMQGADLYLVSYALAHGYVVVTHEVGTNSLSKVKIPDVCSSFGLSCLPPHEMLRQNGARFVLAK